MNSKTNDPQALDSSDLEIEKLVYGGDGLGRLGGQVALVPFVIPGESIQIELSRSKGGLLRGSEPKIVTASPDRVVPRCEYFGSCGGCQYQHLTYELQLQQKKAILLETLARIGGIRDHYDVRIVPSDPWQYRNRIQLHFAQGEMGFHYAGSHALRGIDHCEISSPTLNQVIRALGSASRQNEWPRFLKSLEIFTDEKQVQLNVLETDRPIAARFFDWCSQMIPGFVSGALDYQAQNHAFRISGGSFFQVNRFLIDRLAEEALAGLRGTEALDLYAGVGLFTVPLSRQFERVQAVELAGPAFRDLEFNTGGDSVWCRKGSAHQFLESVTSSPSFILADPPRAGLGKEVTAELLRIQAPQLTVISCDPTTLARDLKPLLSVYSIDSLTLIDLFPQTYHVETIAKLRIN